MGDRYQKGKGLIWPARISSIWIGCARSAVMPARTPAPARRTTVPVPASRSAATTTRRCRCVRRVTSASTTPQARSGSGTRAGAAGGKRWRSRSTVSGIATVKGPWRFFAKHAAQLRARDAALVNVPPCAVQGGPDLSHESDHRWPSLTTLAALTRAMLPGYCLATFGHCLAVPVLKRNAHQNGISSSAPWPKAVGAACCGRCVRCCWRWLPPPPCPPP